MKFLFVLFSLALAITAGAQETAYKALHVVGAAKSQAFLDNLLTLEGSGGPSQPMAWRLSFVDTASRGGVREIEVRGGQITSQRTPLGGNTSSGTPVNLDRLQLDSDGAFTVAQRTAAGQGIAFSKAGYFLETDPTSGNPVWRVQLLDGDDRIALTVRISADRGQVLASSGTRIAPSEERGPVVESSESDTTELKVHRTLAKTGRKIGNGFKHVGGSLQQVFTGKRTIDSDVQDE